MATLSVYELIGGDVWKRAVAKLADSSHVFVTGYQTIGGIAADFVARLECLRPGARFLDGRNGSFGELLADDMASPCLVLFEMRRYTKASLQLAAAARDASIPLIAICDTHCYWARDYTDLVLSVSTQSQLFWDNQAPFLSLSNLLLNSVIEKLGDAIEPRLRKLRALQDRFEAFHD